MFLPEARILVVDDEKNVLITVQAILREDGYEVDIAADGDEAVEAIHARHYDLVITDLKMPGVDGLGVLAEVRKCSPSTVTIMMTGYGSVGSAIEAVHLGAYEYLLKPMEVPELKLAVKRSLERGRLSEVDTLYRIGRAITGSLQRDQIAAETAGAVRSVLRLANARMVFYGPDGTPADQPELAAVLKRPSVHQRLERGEVVASEWAEAQSSELASALGVNSCALVPGVANGKLVCVLAVDNGPEPYEFHSSALRFLQSLTDQSALAIANAWLFEQLQQKNAELEQANGKLKELDRLKSQFLSIATHELRTPLTIIMGYNAMVAESLRGREIAEEAMLLGESVTACQRLIRLVNSMLDINRIEAGKMQMNVASCDLPGLVKNVARMFEAEAKKKGVHLSVELPARMPRLLLDGDRMEQVVINLVGNALKFTAQGGSIRLMLRYLSETELVELAVSDTGIGIAAQDQQLIFDEFAQVERHHGRGFSEGSGLGLAIAKRIVEAHEGNIVVNSVPGQGSIFTVQFPARRALANASSAVPA